MDRPRQRKFPTRRDFLVEAPLPVIPLTEIADNKRVLIENHKGIAAYGSNEIRIIVRNGCNCILGQNLALHCISREKIVITGTIECIRFCREV